MNCRQVHEKIEAYYEGALPETDERGVDIHLVQCPVCNEELGGVDEMIGICHEAFDDAVRPVDIPGLRTGIRDLQQRAEAQAGERRRFNRKDLLMRCAFALVVIPAIWVFGLAAMQTYSVVTDWEPSAQPATELVNTDSELPARAPNPWQ